LVNGATHHILFFKERKKMKRGIKRTLALGSMILLSGMATQAMAAEKPSAEISVLASSKYVWRGFEFSEDSIVLQPSATVSYAGFSANLWGNLDTSYSGANPTTNKWNETDMTLSYDWSMGPVDLGVGYIYYALDGISDTQEFYASAAWDILLTPTLTVYRDSADLPGWYVTLGASYSIPVNDKISIDLGAQGGYLNADDASSYGEVKGGVESTTDAYNGLLDGVLSISAAIPINDYISITPELNYSFALTSDASDLLELRNAGFSGDSNFIYGGVSASLAF